MLLSKMLASNNSPYIFIALSTCCFVYVLVPSVFALLYKRAPMLPVLSLLICPLIRSIQIGAYINLNASSDTGSSKLFKAFINLFLSGRATPKTTKPCIAPPIIFKPMVEVEKAVLPILATVFKKAVSVSAVLNQPVPVASPRGLEPYKALSNSVLKPLLN